MVSVIIPTRNEAGHIERCLESVLAQDYPHDRLEVFIVDGRSTDRTREVVQQTATATDAAVRVLDNPRRTTAAALNLGIARAAGTVIAYVLAHGEIAPDFVSNAVAGLDRTGADVVGPPIRTVGEGRVGAAIAAAVSSPFGVGRALFRYSTTEQEVDTVAFTVYRRDVFHRFGAFDENLVGDEDSEFHFRLKQGGCRITLVPALRATYYSRGSLVGLARQYLTFGAAKATTLRRYPSRIRPWHVAPAALTGSLAIGLALAGVSRPARRATIMIACTYGVANALGTWVAARRRGREVLPFLPLAFAMMHLAYGAGSIAGAVGAWRPGARPDAS